MGESVEGFVEVPTEVSAEEVVEVASDDVDRLELPLLTSSVPSQILVREGYVTSYNSSTKNANWVAWHLTRERSDGPYERKGIPYAVDTEIKGARQELEDWCGLDRPLDHGHMCPAADNKWSMEAMVQSFLLSNMCPQDRELNGGDWEKLERRCRGWARHYGEVFIAAGPIFNTAEPETIGSGVAIPDAFFKVVLRMSPRPAALGFIYPNEGTRHKMDHYVLTVDEVEAATGIDFFYNLPDDIEREVEAYSNLKQW